MLLSAFERGLEVCDVVLPHPRKIVQSFGRVWRDTSKRGGGYDQTRKKGGAGQSVRPTAGYSPNRYFFEPECLRDRGDIVSRAGDAPAWMSCRFSVAWPFVADQSDVPRLRILNPTMIEEAGLWRAPLHQNRNAFGSASFEESKLPPIGCGNDSATTHLPERADALFSARAHQCILERLATPAGDSTRRLSSQPQGVT